MRRAIHVTIRCGIRGVAPFGLYFQKTCASMLQVWLLEQSHRTECYLRQKYCTSAAIRLVGSIKHSEGARSSTYSFSVPLRHCRHVRQPLTTQAWQKIPLYRTGCSDGEHSSLHVCAEPGVAWAERSFEWAGGAQLITGPNALHSRASPQ